MRLYLFCVGTALTCAIAPAAVLEFTKMLGGSRQDFPTAIASDSGGNIYIAGNTESLDFPTNRSLKKSVERQLR